jgi:hypothetical protein
MYFIERIDGPNPRPPESKSAGLGPGMRMRTDSGGSSSFGIKV